MGREPNGNYIKAGLDVLQELGGGPVSTKVVVQAAQERGLLGDGKWVYHNFTRALRNSPLFDTSIRGQIQLAEAVRVPTAEAEISETMVEEEVGGIRGEDDHPFTPEIEMEGGTETL